MTNFYQLDFNITEKESTYLYTPVEQNTQFGFLTLIIGVKQNIQDIGIKNKFFNSIKEVFFKIDNYNLDLYQRCLTVDQYQDLFNTYGTDGFNISPVFGVLDNRQVETNNTFSIFFFDSRI